MDFFYDIIGTNGNPLEWWQMAIRAVIVFVATLVFIRMGATRIFGRNSAFDIVLVIILGSILSRAITGNAPFLPTIVAAIVLIILHVLVAILSLKINWLGYLVKGTENCLIKDGEMQRDQMKSCYITENDLRESLRVKGKDDLNTIRDAYLERSGEISIIFKDDVD